jgi:Holliday junction resolvasome RuvABC endonuclease subunit
MPPRKKKFLRRPREMPASLLVPTILALDLSLTATGVAVIDPVGRLIHSETIKSKLRGAMRIREVREQVRALVRRFTPGLIGCEYFGVAAGKAQRKSAIEVVWLHGNVHVMLVEEGYAAPYFIAPATLKKWFTGRGAKVEKPEIVMALHGHYGLRVPEHNAADAACVGYMLHERSRRISGLLPLRRGEAEWSAYEIEKMDEWQRAFAA